MAVAGDDVKLFLAGQRREQQPRCLGGIHFVIFAPQHQGWDGDFGNALDGVDKKGLRCAREGERVESRQRPWVGLDFLDRDKRGIPALMMTEAPGIRTDVRMLDIGIRRLAFVTSLDCSHARF